MRLKKPYQLSEWRKLSLMFTLGTLFGTIVWVWLVPWLIEVMG